MKKKKVLFIDRDGTIILEPKDNFQIDSLEKLSFVQDALVYLNKIAHTLDYEFVMVTNQDGLGTDSFPEKDFWPAHNKMLEIMQSCGIHFSEILIDRSFAHENRDTRKPGTGMLQKYFSEAYDLKQSFVIGDRLTDLELAANLGAGGIFLNWDNISTHGIPCALETTKWAEIYRFLQFPPRKAEVFRKTNETEIRVLLNLDGIGAGNINTGLGFFDHMLDQLCKHSGCDLNISVAGDLQIDEHHTIEDTAIALGEAFSKALGNKRGIERYGFLLPMDDCLAQVAIDFSGRAWLVWDASFKREKIGEMPTEMFMHFWKSFSDAARCNLHIRAEGENEHHKIESIFKAVAKSIKMAVKRTDNPQLPSTKGVL